MAHSASARKSPAKRTPVKRAKKTSGKAVAKKAAPALPTSITIELDTKPQKFFTGSLNAELRDWTGSEQDLVAKTIQLLPHFTVEELIHKGLQYFCKRELATVLSRAAANADNGIAGQADDRLETSLVECQKIVERSKAKLAKGERLERGEFTVITPWILGEHAKPAVSYRTAKRFMEARGLLADAPIPAAQG